MTTCYNPFSLEGKTILVTGASSGIGRATAIECAKMGAQVIIVARNEVRIAETLSQMPGDNHRSYSVELTDDEQIKTFVKELPVIDGVVLCAGIGNTTPVEFASRKKFDKVANINFFSTVELVRLLLKNKKISKNGSVVAIASVGGLTGYSPGNSIYGSMKAALSSWMKFVAKEEFAKGIRVNCICPGMIETPLISGGAISDEQLAEDAKKYIHKRYGRPEEVAYAAVYFLSDASVWVTGTDFIIDGGKTI